MIAGEAPTLARTAWLGHYLLAIHAGRICLAVACLSVAVLERDEIPLRAPVGVMLAAAALVWSVGVAALWKPVAHVLESRPGLIWLDSAVLIGLSLAEKPWGSLAPLPYGAFALLVPYVRPVQMAAVAIATAMLGYLPRLVLGAGDWRFADRTPPVSGTDWLTLYAGPLCCGAITLALCVLLRGVRNETEAWEREERTLTTVAAHRSELRARATLANRLHETFSQVLRAIPLRLDGEPPAGLVPEAITARSRIVALALSARPAVQQLTRELRDGSSHGSHASRTPRPAADGDGGRGCGDAPVSNA